MDYRKNTENKNCNLIEQMVVKNEGYCPCKIGKLEENKCPCIEFTTTKQETCHCGLYTRKEIVNE